LPPLPKNFSYFRGKTFPLKTPFPKLLSPENLFEKRFSDFSKTFKPLKNLQKEKTMHPATGKKLNFPLILFFLLLTSCSSPPPAWIHQPLVIKQEEVVAVGMGKGKNKEEARRNAEAEGKRAIASSLISQVSSYYFQKQQIQKTLQKQFFNKTILSQLQITTEGILKNLAVPQIHYEPLEAKEWRAYVQISLPRPLYEEAGEEVERNLQILWYNNPELVVHQARWLAKNQEWKKVVNELEPLQAKLPDEGLLLLAQSYFHQKKIKEAKALCKGVIQSNTPQYSQRAKMLLDQIQIKEKEKILKQDEEILQKAEKLLQEKNWQALEKLLETHNKWLSKEHEQRAWQLEKKLALHKLMKKWKKQLSGHSILLISPFWPASEKTAWPKVLLETLAQKYPLQKKSLTSNEWKKLLDKPAQFAKKHLKPKELLLYGLLEQQLELYLCGRKGKPTVFPLPRAPQEFRQRQELLKIEQEKPLRSYYTFVYRRSKQENWQKLKNGSVVREGEAFKIFLKPFSPCYAYVLLKGSSGKIQMLYPNNLQPLAKIPKGKILEIPPRNKFYYFDHQKGQETFGLILTKTPLENAKNYFQKALTEPSRDVLLGTSPDSIQILNGPFIHWEEIQGNSPLLRWFYLLHQ
ncbi:MAG: DUF4384 domain-containing protein, partial [Planctomycetota bacterium]